MSINSTRVLVAAKAFFTSCFFFFNDTATTEIYTLSLHDALPIFDPREAFLGAAEQVAVDAAVGRISCESIASYPPGVPALLPGERISAETVAYLRELAGSGARLHGASDPSFHTINVLEDRRRRSGVGGP